MTDLDKPISRRTKDPWNYQKRRLVVTLFPGDVIEMREERSQKSFSAPLSRVFQQIVQWNVDAERGKRKKPRGGVK
jgi:hypothetical protein